MKAIVWLAAAALVHAAPVLEQSDREGLESAVRTYWDHLQSRHRSEALAFVTSETRPWFLARHEPPFRSWQLSSIEPQGQGVWRVAVVVDRLIQDGFFGWKVREDWVWAESGWKVRIPDQSVARKKIWRAQAPLQPQPGVLDLLPSALRLHFFSGSQTGTVWVRNGLSEPVEVTSLKFDHQLFEVIESVPAIPALSVGKISIRYRGREVGKGLESSLSLGLKTSRGDEASYAVPIAYNLISRAARALLGLTPEQANKLQKTDKVVPGRPGGGQ